MTKWTKKPALDEEFDVIRTPVVGDGRRAIDHRAGIVYGGVDVVTDPQNDTDDEHDRWIPDDEWRKIVANVPLVSVDRFDPVTSTT